MIKVEHQVLSKLKNQKTLKIHRGLSLYIYKYMCVKITINDLPAESAHWSKLTFFTDVRTGERTCGRLK